MQDFEGQPTKKQNKVKLKLWFLTLKRAVFVLSCNKAVPFHFYSIPLFYSFWESSQT